jgi:CBS domain-containing protein
MAQHDTVRALLQNKGSWVCSVAPETSVYEALELMADKDIGAVVVVSRGQLCGVFSERDYARKVILLGKSSKETSVQEIMSTPAITVAMEQTVDDCMQLMTSLRIRHLPVLDAGEVVGVMSIGDLVNWTMKRQQEEIQHLNNYVRGAYPA